MQNTSSSKAQKSRLYWQCRRGMLELDCLLQGFVNTDFDALSQSELVLFESLLKYSDNVLLEYLMGRTVPTDPGMANVVAKIRQSSVY
ncbi:MAG: succinate dehydrogenase assembly factor 2 [Gammaproteobacteria bacterium]|nr:succinate dehydrogenase assembly factor 2 [Gammaproteobacteria bacterium]